MGEESGGNAHVLDADQAAGGGLGLAFSSSSSNSGIPVAARVASGPGEMACTRMPFGPSSHFDRRAIARTDRQRPVHHELHIARPARFVACRRDLVGYIGG